MGRYVWFRLKDMISVKVSYRGCSKGFEYFSCGRWS